MLAIQIAAPGRPEFVEVPVPTLRPGCGLVRPLLLSLCGSDVRSVYYAPEDEYPLAVGRGGREVIAQVEALDGSAAGVDVGDSVMALVPGDAGMSERFVTATDNLLALPPDCPHEHLLMAQQLGTVIFACRRLPNVVGRTAVVIGQGSAGLFFDAMLRRLGAARVVALDVIEQRVAAGLKLGATDALNIRDVDPVSAVADITGGRMADLVVEAVGEPETINLMPRLVKKGGHLMSFGVPRGPHVFPFDYYSLFRKTCHFTSSDGTIEEPGRRSTRMALDLIAMGEIDVTPMLTHRLSFARVKEAYELARSREEGVIKIIIDMVA